MVSLAPENRRPGQGGYFFDPDASVNSNSEDVFSEHTLLSSEIDPPVRSICTVWAIVLETIIVVVLEVLIFVLPITISCPEKQCSGVKPYSLIIYIHAAVWLITMLIDRYLRYQHNISRRNGYLEFYRRTRHIRRVPFLIYSTGNAVLTVAMILLEDYCPNTNNCSAMGIQKCNYLQIIISLETIVILPFITMYLVRTVRFNRSQVAPDACQDELMTSFLNSQAQTTEVGFRDDDYLDEVLEKQADMIRYLRQHNANLGKKIVQLSAELSATRRL